VFPEGLAKVRGWFLEVEAWLWDRQIAEDLKEGKLDQLIAEAREDLQAGRAREIRDPRDLRDSKDTKDEEPERPRPCSP
jgi:hypothetical protein